MKRFFLVLTSFFCFSYGYSQQNLDSIISNYSNHYANKLTLFYGKEQLKYPLAYIGNPYYHQNQNYVNATLEYDHILYPNVPLRIDLYKNELIVQSPNPPFNVVLNNSRVESFSINDTVFVYLSDQQISRKDANAYYAKFQIGSMTLFFRPVVELVEVKINDRLMKQFKRHDQFLLYQQGSYYKLTGKSSLFKVFKEKKTLFADIVNAEQLDFKENPLYSYITVLNHIK